MAAPQFVPTTLEEQPRKGLPLPPAGRWLADRPGELRDRQPQGPQLGVPGPDQGFALKLVKRFEGALRLTPPEHVADASAGCVAVAMKRASLFGRAPVIHDIEIGFRLWGFVDEAPAELVALRIDLFDSAAHHYELQRAIADAVPGETLRLTLDEIVRRSPGEWRVLLGR